MLSSAGYYDRYHSITGPAIDGGIDRATSLRVDRYRLGAQQPFVDERYKLGRKIEEADGKNGLARTYYAYLDHQSQADVFRFYRGLNGSPPWTA
jgi:hypothetical protein